LIKIGYVVKSQGRKGEIKVRLNLGQPEKLFFFKDISQNKRQNRRIKSRITPQF
jgi:ribosomal 30S subunit maturation factor RimM